MTTDLLVVHDGMCLYHGELFELEQLRRRLARPQSMFAADRKDFIREAVLVTDQPGELLGTLDAWFGDDSGDRDAPYWQYRITPREVSPWSAEEVPESTIELRVSRVDWLGWSRRSRVDNVRRLTRSRVFAILDPGAFLNADIDPSEAYPGRGRLEQLLAWAEDVSAFCEEEGISLRKSAAAIGAAKLTAMIPRGSRKCPRATNARARGHLPGNYYKLLTHVPGQGHPLIPIEKVYNLDLSQAHHRAALRLQLPNPEDLWAWGRFYDPPAAGEDASDWQTSRYGVYDEHGSPGYDRIVSEQHGLLCLIVEVVRPSSNPLGHPFAQQQGCFYRYVYTNELQQLERTPGVRIRGVVAGWTSPDVDYRLAEYSWWAQGVLQKASELRKGWLKPALLATYGLLAVRPRSFCTAYRWTRTNNNLHRRCFELAGFVLGAREVQGREFEPRYANVIWRGMIEAWQRSETLAYANELRAAGWRVLCVYADSLYVQAKPSGERPPERNLWRIKSTLTNVRFPSATQLLSDQEVKLPGITGQERRIFEQYYLNQNPEIKETRIHDHRAAA